MLVYLLDDFLLYVVENLSVIVDEAVIAQPNRVDVPVRFIEFGHNVFVNSDF